MENIENQLTKVQIIEQVSNAAQSENFAEKAKELKELKVLFSALTREEEKLQRQEFEAREKMEEDEEFVFAINPLDAQFYELLKDFNEKMDHHKAKVAEQEKVNYEVKSGLLNALKVLVEENMQNVGAAFAKFYEIRDAWSNTGQVNKSKFKQLQYDYSHYRELFYYNVGIHHELKNYDLKKNAEQKQQIIEELKAAFEQDSIKKMEKAVKELQAKWDEIGPTTNETWEGLKNDYWELVNGIYEKVKMHYKALRETEAKIIEEKKKLIEQMQNLNSTSMEFKLAKEWAQLSDQVNALHAEWKNTGFLPKGKEDEYWNQFKEFSDALRTKKNDYFGALKEVNAKVIATKNKLIEQAQAIKDSKEWKTSTERLIQLQKQWKSAGQAQRKLDQELWEKFRAVCDEFFAAKNEYFGGLDERQENNFKAKEELVAKIAIAANEEELRSLISQWQTVDYVPKKQIAASEASFERALKEAAKNLKIDENSLSSLRFEAKVSALKADENGEAKLKTEKLFVQTQIEKIKEEMHRFEENMGFFGQSKGSQKLKEVVEKRLEEAAQKLQDWQEKMKLLK